MRYRHVLFFSFVLIVGLAYQANAAPPSKDISPGGTPAQNWDRNLPSNSRFTVLTEFGGAAVRDNNTGLVWEQTIDLTNRAWVPSLSVCINKNVGGAVGWRLPSVVELKSVEDPLLPFPYINSIFSAAGIVSFNNWWSATTSPVTSDDAWIVDIGGRVNGNNKSTGQGLAWCVRGPMNADRY